MIKCENGKMLKCSKNNCLLSYQQNFISRMQEKPLHQGFETYGPLCISSLVLFDATIGVSCAALLLVGDYF